MRAEHDTISGVSSLRHPTSEADAELQPADAPEVGPINELYKRPPPVNAYYPRPNERQNMAQREVNEFYRDLLNISDAELCRGVIVREVEALAPNPDMFPRTDDPAMDFGWSQAVGRIQDPTCSPGRAAHIVQDVGWRTQMRTRQMSSTTLVLAGAAVVGTIGFWVGVIIGVSWLIAG